MSNTFAGQSVYKDLEAAEEKIEQLEDVIKALRKGPRQIDLSSCEARVKELDGKIEQLQSKLTIAMGCINEIAKLTAPGGFPSYTHLWYLTAKATDAIDALAQPLENEP